MFLFDAVVVVVVLGESSPAAPFAPRVTLLSSIRHHCFFHADLDRAIVYNALWRRLGFGLHGRTGLPALVLGLDIVCVSDWRDTRIGTGEWNRLQQVDPCKCAMTIKRRRSRR